MTCVFGMLQTAACDQEQIAMTSRLPDDEPSCTCAGVLGASRLESGSAEHKSAVFTEKTRSVPFKAGDLGYAYFRIPALVSLASGRLLLVVEGRRDSAQDYGQIDLVQTMSDDGGVTWTSPQVIAHGDGRASTNPALVEAAGRLVLVFRETPAEASEARIRAGEFEGDVSMWVMHSADDGRSWGSPHEITEQVRVPGWRWLVIGPGHGIRLGGTGYEGRLVFGANHSTPGGVEDQWLSAHLVYSDDDGDTFDVGAVEPVGEADINANESSIAELSDGTLYINTRNQKGTNAVARADTYSRDGGASYEHRFWPAPALVGPIVHASVLAGGGCGGGLFLGMPTDPMQRRDFGLYTSFDDGQSWGQATVLTRDWSAYSDLAWLQGGGLGVVLEAGRDGPTEEIRFLGLDVCVTDPGGHA